VNTVYKINAAEIFIFLYGCKCSTSEKSKWLGCRVNVMNFQVALNMSIIWKYKHSYYEVVSDWIVEPCSPNCLVQWTPDEVLLILQTLSQNYFHLQSPKAHLVITFTV